MRISDWSSDVCSSDLYFVPAARWGQKMGEAVMQDGLTGALTDPFQSIHMGVTAENVATRYGISRAEQDALALESQRRAGNAIAQGYFRDQIVPVEVTVKRKPASFETDE